MDANPLSLLCGALEIYEYLCQPLCKEYNIQQTALDILMFLYNHPEQNTAVDIQRLRGIKQSKVSFYVERLVQSGYLTRLPVPEDRRKVRLVCTEKAEPIVKKGNEIVNRFYSYIPWIASKEDLEAYNRVISSLQEIVNDLRERMQRGELN